MTNNFIIIDVILMTTLWNQNANAKRVPNRNPFSPHSETRIYRMQHIDHEKV